MFASERVLTVGSCFEKYSFINIRGNHVLVSNAFN
jgi:hypothetical protein